MRMHFGAGSVLATPQPSSAVQRSSSSAAHSNLSIVQLLAGDLGAAERTARRALELSRDNDWARFVLGVTLLRNAATYSDALRHLESAARSVPAARETLNALQAK